jgi:hypothetical protein
VSAGPLFGAPVPVACRWCGGSHADRLDAARCVEAWARKRHEAYMKNLAARK